jgi:hypothetical protein
MPKVEPNGLTSAALSTPGPPPPPPSHSSTSNNAGSSGGVAGTSSSGSNPTPVINNSSINNNGSGGGPGGLGVVPLVGGALPPLVGGGGIPLDMPQKKFPCHLCRRSFMHKQSLDIHMRSHTGNYLFSLSQHMQICAAFMELIIINHLFIKGKGFGIFQCMALLSWLSLFGQ